MNTALKQHPERRHIDLMPLFGQRVVVEEVALDAMPAFGDKDSASGTVLRNVAIVQEGEAKGHDVWMEPAFVDKIVALGNALPMGIKSRFDHPGRCTTEMGWQVGRVMNFRADTDPNGKYTAFGDLFLFDSAKVSPHGDLHAYTVAASKEHPDTFGMSIVFTPEDEQYTYDPQGNKVKESEYYDVPVNTILGVEMRTSKDWEPEKWYEMPKALHASDVVDDPAATSSFFSSGGPMEEFFAGMLSIPGIEKVIKSLAANEAAVSYLKRAPKVYKGLYKALHNQPQPSMQKKKFDIGAVTDTGARLVVVTDAEQIAPGDAVNVVAEDGTIVPAPAGPHLIVESDSGQTGTIVVDDMGVIQEMTDGLAATEDPAAAPGGEGEEKTGDVAALSAQIRDLRTQLAAKDAAFEQRLAAIEKGQTTFGNQLKSLFTRLKIVEAQPAGMPLPGAGSDARGAGKKSDVAESSWNQAAAEQVARYGRKKH